VAKVVATDIDAGSLEDLIQDNIETHVLDVTDNSAVARFFKNQATFNGIVNMAGWVHHGQLHEVSEENWQKSFLINVDSMFYVLRAALPAMIAEGGGSIVNMASLASSVKGFPYRAAYGASKAAVIGLTKSVAVDHMHDGIRANAICPGTIETPSLKGRIKALSLEVGSIEKARAWFVDRQPMKRLGQPEEIAKLVIYLLSDDGSYATGQAYIIDGGTTG
jgi:2-keto-3-deoxy-L-fuconate dehydrogenase